MKRKTKKRSFNVAFRHYIAENYLFHPISNLTLITSSELYKFRFEKAKKMSKVYKCKYLTNGKYYSVTPSYGDRIYTKQQAQKLFPEFFI